MGIPNFLIASSMRCIVAQRLVRKLCPHCKREMSVTGEMASEIKIPEGSKIYAPVGCASCRFTGYSGRTVIGEIMVIDAALRDMINNGRPQHEIKEYAVNHGMETLRDIARKKVLEGIISVEEMLISTMFE